ncbi:MAG: hypothetical protein WCG20_03220 [bacterium]
MLGKHSYTYQQLKIIILNAVQFARSQSFTNTVKPVEEFILIWGPVSANMLSTVTYKAKEQLKTDLGTRETILSFSMDENQLSELCKREILKAKGVSEKNYKNYFIRNIKKTESGPHEDDELFFSFEIYIK